MPKQAGSFGNSGFEKNLPEGFKKKLQLEKEAAEENQRIQNEGLTDQLANLKSGGASTQPFKIAQTKTQNIGGTISLDKIYGKSEPGGIHLILGMTAPVGGTNTNLFTVLSKHTAQITVLWVANRRLIPAKIRVGFDVAGSGTNVVIDAAWLYFQVEVPAESTLVLDAARGFWLGAADDVVVRTDISGVSFGASGILYATV